MSCFARPALFALVLLAAVAALPATALAQAGAAPGAAPGARQNPARGLVVPGVMPDPANITSGRVGTRLEAGAVMCRTPEALARRQQALLAQSNGDDSLPVLPADCVMLAGRTPVEVVERRGPGRTQVRTLAQRPETGWTDAYLPPR